MSRIKNPENETSVKGLRAKPEQWARWNEQANTENKSTNKLIVEATEQYCDVQDGKKKREK